MLYFPVCLDLKDKKCVVIGGGAVAERKVLALLSCRARVTVVSPEVTVELEKLSTGEKVNWLQRTYRTGDLAGAFVAVAATGEARINRLVSEEAFRTGVLVNVVDAPELSNFIVPATMRRGNLSISVSTDGKSPLLARRIREKLEEEYDHAYAGYLNLLGEARDLVLQRVGDPGRRREYFRSLIDEGGLLEVVRQEGVDKAREVMYQLLADLGVLD